MIAVVTAIDVYKHPNFVIPIFIFESVFGVVSGLRADFLVRVFAVFDPVARSRLFDLGKERRVSSEKARKMLGWTTRQASESILDTARSLQAEGLVLNGR